MMMSFTLFQDSTHADPFLDTFEQDLKKFCAARSNICKKICFILTFGGLSALTVYLGKTSKEISNSSSYDSQSSDFVMISFCALISGGVSVSLLCCCIRELLRNQNSNDILISDLPLHMQNNVHQLIYTHALQPDHLLTVGDVRLYCQERMERNSQEMKNMVA